MNTFEIGKSYTINDMSGHTYDNAKVIAFDENFIRFSYSNYGIIHSKILNLKCVANATTLTKDNKKTYWYWGLFESKYFSTPRYGIGRTVLSDEERKLNIEAGLQLFEDKDSAKNFLFLNATSGKYESEYFTFEDDNCALYYKGNDEWSGKLSDELSDWLKK